jgi:hypothetical protein
MSTESLGSGGAAGFAGQGPATAQSEADEWEGERTLLDLKNELSG